MLEIGLLLKLTGYQQVINFCTHIAITLIVYVVFIVLDELWLS